MLVPRRKNSNTLNINYPETNNMAHKILIYTFFHQSKKRKKMFTLKEINIKCVLKKKKVTNFDRIDVQCIN